ncbi:YlxM family DNA-binding protein [Paenibacillus pinihumi]|uniref:YlxM family DNA-binding protein n=1 Tax=Paenibacillus pinihumi TaxID=669462 RepID=UPI00056D18F8|nr:YlxM family DNA-binding protein [Paenibacillus pinihumi]
MNEPDALGKTTRINLLFDFYEMLLTDKQRTFLKYYFHDDYSLGEIAAEFEISRQAVYEHVKRAEQALEGYEQKLGLLRRHEALQEQLARLEALGMQLPAGSTERAELQSVLEEIRRTDSLIDVKS